MDLTPAETDDLAAFFARRFPRHSDRESLAAQLGLPLQSGPSSSARSDWAALLRQASAAGRLSRLGLIAARSDLHDQNLQAVCALLCGKPNPGSAVLLPPISRAVAAAAAIGAAALLVTGLFAATGPSASARSAAVQEGEAAAHIQAIAVAAPAAGAGPAAASPSGSAAKPPGAAPGAPGGATVAPEGARLAVPHQPVSPADEAGRAQSSDGGSAEAGIASGASSSSGRCTRSGGGVVGYYYAGLEAPGAAGEIITAPGPVNVRADYPDVHNDFDARAPVRCTLGAGDRLRLTANPIQVPGDAWWVPVHSGDLLRD